jgi:ribonuclease R
MTYEEKCGKINVPMSPFRERPGQFSRELLNEARVCSVPFSALNKRPVVQGVTIDGPTSKDLDDAIWLEERNGNTLVSVSIADVDSLVPKGSMLDEEAYSRLFTRYYRNYNNPMFPRTISEGKMSLLEGQLRPTLTVSIELSPEREILSVDVRETVLRSQKRFTYAEVDTALLNGTKSHNTMLRQCGVLAQQLLIRRQAKGAIAFYDIQRKIRTNEEGALQALKENERHQSNIIVQEFMILANQAVAQFCKERGVPFPFRNHVATTVRVERTHVLQQILELIAHPQKDVTTKGIIFGRAEYEPEPNGHFALNLPAYTHWTSPIRRYPDLVGHRIVKAIINEQELPYSSTTLHEICAYMNTNIRIVLDAKREALGERSKDRFRETILNANRTHFQKLTASTFSPFLKRACNDDTWSDAFQEEVLQRLSRKNIHPIDLYYIIFYSDIECLVHKALDTVAEQPHWAKEVIMLLVQKKDWDAYVCDVQEENGGFTAQPIIAIGEEIFSIPKRILMRSKADAEQSAALSLIRGYVDGTLIHPDTESVPIVSGVQPKTKKKQVEKTPISALYEFCDQNGLPKPTIRSENIGGPGHAPVFSGYATIPVDENIFEGKVSDGKNSRDAEQRAAGQLLEKLQKERHLKSKKKEIEKTPITELYEFCTQQKLPTPIIRSENIGGPGHAPVFSGYAAVSMQKKIYEGKIDDGKNKRDAEQRAAQQLLEKILIVWEEQRIY